MVIELRSTSPLVDVRAVRHPAVAGGNLARFVGGIGMYLLLTLVTRYAQTPHGSGSGFGLTTFVVELALIPFSVIGFVAGKLTPRVRRADRRPPLLAGSAVVVGGGFALFVAVRSDPAELLVVDGRARLQRRRPLWPDARPNPGRHSQGRDVERHERQLRRAQRWLLPGQRHRRWPEPRRGHRPGHTFPDDSAYTTAALIGIDAMAITTLTSLALARRRPSEGDSFE
ncbi:hypothetical protein [Streptomyces sp. RM72]|uniref:hypothetical protein n=1 Tax=Streptomyces sp. RM72 TaxID=1115510 RepID=UPI001FFDDD77|nr:hypothetical protein [Streptomyces sp. RM72]